jgi:hypothetical protein
MGEASRGKDQTRSARLSEASRVASTTSLPVVRMCEINSVVETLYNRYMLNVKNEKRSDYGVITNATTIPNETMKIVNEY